MIPIVKGMLVPGAPNLVVTTDDGQYGDYDLIQCADVLDQTTGICAFQAQFIRYGKLVYQYETPEDLGAAIVALDPQSTHDAAQLWQEDLARKEAREKGTLTPENPTPAPDAVDPTAPTTPADAPDASAQQTILDADPNGVGSMPPDAAPIDPSADLNPPLIEPDPSLAPDLPVDLPGTDATVTPDAGSVASTTPMTDAATTTPPVEAAPAVDLSTTTPE